MEIFQLMVVLVAWAPFSIYLASKENSRAREGGEAVLLFLPCAFFSGLISSLPLGIAYHSKVAPVTFIVSAIVLSCVIFCFREKLWLLFLWTDKRI